MRVRTATLADIDFIVAANRALASESEGLALDESVLRAGVRAVLDHPLHGTYYLAESEGKVTGQLMTTSEWSDWRNGRFLWIQSVYVLPEWRGRGVFRALFAHLAQRAQADAGICGIRLYVDRDNRRAQEVYARLGMHRSNYGVMETVYRGPESREGRRS